MPINQETADILERARTYVVENVLESFTADVNLTPEALAIHLASFATEERLRAIRDANSEFIALHHRRANRDNAASDPKDCK